MSRLLRSITLGILIAYAAPSFAQSFEGLDSTDSPKKKKRRKKKEPKPTEAETPPAAAPAQPEAPPQPAAPAPAVTPPPKETPPASDGLGLDLTAPTPLTKDTGKKSKKGDKGDKTAPGMTFDAIDVSGKTESRQKLDAAIGLFKKDQYEQAALASFELAQDPKFADLALEADYVLAKSLYRMGLYHSALGEFSKILAKGPETKLFKTSLEWLFYISRKTTNESVILDEIAKYANNEFPEKFRNEFRYLLARYHFVRGRALDRADQKQEASKSYEEVKRIALTVPKTDPFYPRAKYLEGLAYFRDGNFNAAVEAMKEVVRLTRPGGGKSGAQARLDEDLRELAFMQLARTHYGNRQNRYAIYYYGKVERGNEQWLEALFESSWANYRIGQYEQALGNLITLSSPFFRDEYFPEALILKAVIYYENCRYRESTSILEDFERIYLPVHDELEQILKKDLDASGFYNVLDEVQKKNKGQKANTDVILEKILRLALTDQDLKKTNDSILELEGELDSFSKKSDSFRYSELVKTLAEELKLSREALVKKAGAMAKSKLDAELGALKRLLADGLRIKFETTTKEKEFLEEQLKAGGRTELVKKYKFSVAVADDQLYWPYEGEYWRDELGTYQYTLTKGCVDRDTANRAGGEGP